MTNILGHDHLRRYAAIRTGLSAGALLTVLQIGEETTTIVCGKTDSPKAFIALNIGAQRTALAFFKHNPPTPSEMEEAIMTVEDEVARAQATIPEGSSLFTNDAAICEIAMFAGLAPQPVMHFGLTEVETTFDRLVSIVHGRPASAEGLPTNHGFAATLLILRELMHHLKFSSIAVIS
jgi:exopolyphosphatase/pppGpp-phosphohydrolase